MQEHSAPKIIVYLIDLGDLMFAKGFGFLMGIMYVLSGLSKKYMCEVFIVNILECVRTSKILGL
jgi:hypothetical protein